MVSIKAEVKKELREEIADGKAALIRLEALRGSIRKWEKIVDGTGKDEGVNNCPLCKVFSKKENNYSSCIGCPVAEKTEAPFCYDTPYDKWIALHDEHDIDYPSGISDFPTRAQGKAKKLAQKELEFLKGLLP